MVERVSHVKVEVEVEVEVKPKLKLKLCGPLQGENVIERGQETTAEAGGASGDGVLRYSVRTSRTSTSPEAGLRTVSPE